MKKLLFIFALLVTITLNAQNSGLGFNYQGVIRNANGVLLSDTIINLRVSLYPGQEAATPAWVEIQNPRTDMSGSFAIKVGNDNFREPSSVVSHFMDINFAAIYYWLKIEILEGNTYKEVSFSRLPNSPYAEVAYNATLYPAGMISSFAGPVEDIPYGWMLCDGSEVSRTEYANLYNAIGVYWGTGNGSTTFNLPDLRGMFLRGVSGDSGNDEDADSRIVLYDNDGNTGNQVGSYQEDAIRNITGAVHHNIQGHRDWGSQTEGAMTWIDERGDASWEDNTPGYSGISFDASRVVPVGNDNRPKNVYVNYIIKY